MNTSGFYTDISADETFRGSFISHIGAGLNWIVDRCPMIARYSGVKIENNENNFERI
jgi:hypothetical protein